VEEVLTVLSGTVEIWLGDERAVLTSGESIIVPAGTEHGFRNAGNGRLHMLAILSAPYFEAVRSPHGDGTSHWKSTSA
jgi:mannose-6-phosphate isomerase-like protein (cupin superfamily)